MLIRSWCSITGASSSVEPMRSSLPVGGTIESSTRSSSPNSPLGGMGRSRRLLDRAKEEAGQKDSQHEQGDGGVDQVVLDQKGDDRHGNPEHWRGDQQHEAEVNDRTWAQGQEVGEHLVEPIGNRGAGQPNCYAASAFEEQEERADQDDQEAEQNPVAQNYADDILDLRRALFDRLAAGHRGIPRRRMRPLHHLFPSYGIWMPRPRPSISAQMITRTSTKIWRMTVPRRCIRRRVPRVAPMSTPIATG